MLTQNFHCFFRQQLPVPGSHAQGVTYPACEWRELGKTEDVAMHPLNRFVCSWLTSDMAEIPRCEEVLHAMHQIDMGHCDVWFVDGDLFTVDLRREGVQFNPSNVEPEDGGYWHPPEGRFTLTDVRTLLRAWRDFLSAAETPPMQ